MRKTIVMNVDFFDEVSIRKEPFGPDDVEELVRRCAQAGVDTVCWRAIGLGVAGYPSQLLQTHTKLRDSDMRSFMPRMAADQQDADPQPPDAKPGEPFTLDLTHQAGYRARMDRWHQRVAASLDLMDPIAEAHDACKRHGLRFFIWHDFIDERHNLALATHPGWQVMGRDGVTPFPGLRSYAVEEAVLDQLSVIEELLAYRPDGLYLCTSCHNRHLAFSEPDDFFGFEPPVVEACREAMGLDIRTQPFDHETWHDIKGRFITDFFRRVKALAKPVGAKLAIGTQLGKHTILTSPVFSTRVPYRFTTQWKTWVDESIADILVLGDYEWPWDRVPIWEAKGMTWPDGSYAADIEWKPYAEHCGERAELYWFSSWLSAYAAHHEGASADSLAAAMRMRADTLAATPVNGICLHEAMTFEQATDAFETIASMRHALNGEPGPTP